MEELHAEGLATHGDPESCVDDPRGRGEALTGARAGRAIEPRNREFGVPTLFKEAEGNIAGGAIARRWRTPRGLRTMACTEPPSARTGRSQRSPTGLITGVGRLGNTEVVIPR
jgi:hypothetical protein